MSLIDAQGVVVMDRDERNVGQREPSPALRAALQGRTYAGQELEADEEESNFEFLAPVELPSGIHALEVDQDGGILERELSTLIERSIAVAGGALLVGLALFFLLGGRNLTRRHHQALDRATLDALTELGNHRSFQDDLRAAVALARRQDRPLSVVLMDVDDFKLVNDRRGHREGDRHLTDLAALLRSGREEDRAFRIGGDEFALLLPDCDGAAASDVLQRLLRDAPQLGFTAGVATLDGRAAIDSALLWERADTALYEGKRRRRGGVTLFDEIADKANLATPEKLRALAELLDAPRIDVVFQPIWRLHGEERAPLGYEALARLWSGYGFDGPADAFAAAEKAGRAHELDGACRAAVLERAAEVPAGALLFLNVHPHSLSTGTLRPEELVAALARRGIAPGHVVLEITERPEGRLDTLVTAAARLRAAGFKLGLDDVGSGNSGLETLRRMPVDFVKIDRTVIAGALEDESAHGVLLAIVAYARRTGAFVIAEGIESDEMLELVRDLHAEERARTLDIEGAQGFLLGMPEPVPEADPDALLGRSPAIARQ